MSIIRKRIEPSMKNQVKGKDFIKRCKKKSEK